MWWWHTFGLLLIAGLLITKGLCGKYKGDEPRCRKCKCKLENASCTQCPSCQIELEPDDITIGLKKIQWRWIMLACTVPLFWQPTIDLYRHWEGSRTEHWVSTSKEFEKAISGDASAIRELNRRIDYDPPSEKDIRNISAHAVARHESQRLDKIGQAWLKVLKSLDYHGYLSQEEKDLVFPKYAQATITCREHVRIGDPLPIKISFSNYKHGLVDYKYWLEMQKITVKDFVILEGTEDSWRERPRDWANPRRTVSHYKFTSVQTGNIPIGVHKLQYCGKHILNNPRFDPKVDPPSWTNEFILETTVELLPSDSEDLVTWVDRPELLSFMKWSVNLELSKWNNIRSLFRSYIKEIQGDDTSTYIPIRCELHQSLPEPIAFEFVVETGSASYPATVFGSTVIQYTGRNKDQFVCKQGDKCGNTYILKVPRLQTDEVYITLRASKDAARKTLDMYRVWKGELRFGPFKIVDYPENNG